MSRAATALVLIFLAAVMCSRIVRGDAASGPADPRQSPIAVQQAERARESRALARLEHRRLQWPEDRALFAEAAKSAWSYVMRMREPTTGLVKPLEHYDYVTVWDIGSMLAALYSAHGLGLIDTPAYESWVGQILDTLARAPMYDNRVLNKWYDARAGGKHGRGYGDEWWGWSTTDLGRLLVWLKIVGTGSRFEPLTTQIVQRNDFRQIVDGGYLWGEDRDQAGHPRRYQEGRIGYEQYAAWGFALWGHRAEKALRLAENAIPIEIMGEKVAADVRRWDRLNNEPFLLWGLEIGWDAETEAFVRRLLNVQQARFRQTGQVTITGEDAIPLPPHYFYYYDVYANGMDFAVEVHDRDAVVDGPRWISAKSALAAHALIPGRYTQAAVAALRPTLTGAKWGSGLYEQTGAPTGGGSINMAGVILTAALVHQTGEPVLAHARRLAGEEQP
jgi:uncharacterized protein DUF3131